MMPFVKHFLRRAFMVLLKQAMQRRVSVSNAKTGWNDLVTDRSWLEAVIEREGNVASGLIENIQLEGVYVSLLDRYFLPEDPVRIDLCVRDLDRPRHALLAVWARVVQSDKGGAYFRFRPMALSDHAVLREIIDCAPAYKGGDKNRLDEIVYRDPFDLSSSLSNRCNTF